MIMSKILKRHVFILERSSTTSYEIVADLDDPDQLNKAGDFRDVIIDNPEPLTVNINSSTKDEMKYKTLQ